MTVLWRGSNKKIGCLLCVDDSRDCQDFSYAVLAQCKMRVFGKVPDKRESAVRDGDGWCPPAGRGEKKTRLQWEPGCVLLLGWGVGFERETWHLPAWFATALRASSP